MAEISVGGAINEGFSLIRRAPIAVVLWGLARLSLTILSVALLAPFYLGLFAAARSGAGASALQAMSPQMMQVQGLSYVIDLLQVAVYAIVYCAVFRAVLHPERRQFGFLRLSMPELLVGALLIGAGFALGMGLAFAIIVVAIVAGVLAAMHAIWAAVIVAILAVFAMIGGLIYLVLRFSLVGPMIVEDGQFHLGDAWAQTRGHVWRLFLIGLVMTVIVIAAEILFAIIAVALGGGILIAMARGLQNLPGFFQQPPQALLAQLGPLAILVVAIWIPLVGGLTAVMGAPWARAYRDLKPTDISTTFA